MFGLELRDRLWNNVQRKCELGLFPQSHVWPAITALPRPNKSVRFARGFPHDGSRSCLEIFGDNGYQYASNRQERHGIFCVFDLWDRQRAGRGKGLLCFNRCLYSILASVTLSVVLVGLSYVPQGSCPACPASSQGIRYTVPVVKSCQNMLWEKWQTGRQERPVHQ